MRLLQAFRHDSCLLEALVKTMIDMVSNKDVYEALVHIKFNRDAVVKCKQSILVDGMPKFLPLDRLDHIVEFLVAIRDIVEKSKEANVHLDLLAAGATVLNIKVQKLDSDAESVILTVNERVFNALTLHKTLKLQCSGHKMENIQLRITQANIHDMIAYNGAKASLMSLGILVDAMCPM